MITRHVNSSHKFETSHWSLYFHLLETHGLTFACNVGLPGVLKKDATAARQRALPWLGWYPLFCPEFTSVTSATASCYPAWLQQNLQGRHCMRNSSNHFSTGSKVRIAGWIALCQRYQCLWWVFLRRSLTMKKVDLVNFSMIQTVKGIQFILHSPCHGCWPPLKNQKGSTGRKQNGPAVWPFRQWYPWSLGWDSGCSWPFHPGERAI